MNSPDWLFPPSTRRSLTPRSLSHLTHLRRLLLSLQFIGGTIHPPVALISTVSFTLDLMISRLGRTRTPRPQLLLSLFSTPSSQCKLSSEQVTLPADTRERADDGAGARSLIPHRRRRRRRPSPWDRPPSHRWLAGRPPPNPSPAKTPLEHRVGCNLSFLFSPQKNRNHFARVSSRGMLTYLVKNFNVFHRSAAGSACSTLVAGVSLPP